jgi:hypothetical protein
MSQNKKITNKTNKTHKQATLVIYHPEIKLHIKLLKTFSNPQNPNPKPKKP